MANLIFRNVLINAPSAHVPRIAYEQPTRRGYAGGRRVSSKVGDRGWWAQWNVPDVHPATTHVEAACC